MVEILDKEEMKIYCFNCRNVCPYTAGCYKKKTKESNALYKSETLGSCRVINANNDCKNYQRKWWKFWVK